MNALALYNLKQLPKVEAVSVPQRPAKRVRIQSFSQDCVEYFCLSCSKKVSLSANDLVQCPHCDNRVVAKTQVNKPRTYDAV